MSTKGVIRPRAATAHHLPLKEQVAIVEDEGIESFMRNLCRETTGHSLSAVIPDEHKKLFGSSYGGYWYQWAQDWLHGDKRCGCFLLPLLEEAETRKNDALFVCDFLLNPAEHRQRIESVRRLTFWADPAPCGVFFIGRFFTPAGLLRSDGELKRLGVSLAEILESETKESIRIFDDECVLFNTNEMRHTVDFLNKVAGIDDNDSGGLGQKVDTWLRTNISKRERENDWTVEPALVECDSGYIIPAEDCD